MIKCDRFEELCTKAREVEELKRRISFVEGQKQDLRRQLDAAEKSRNGWRIRAQWSWLKKLRRWVIWVGGWEKVNGAGWAPLIAHVGENVELKDITPVSLFGGLLTFQFFGLDVSAFGTHLCIHRRRRGEWWPWYAYISPDATPGGSTTWLFGPGRPEPREVEAA